MKVPIRLLRICHLPSKLPKPFCLPRQLVASLEKAANPNQCYAKPLHVLRVCIKVRDCPNPEGVAVVQNARKKAGATTTFFASKLNRTLPAVMQKAVISATCFE
ncbi:hypothetical protein [Ferrovibrio sp.]|uniref:hypothetical protein n=1 Tax=Ferrovibrio sp. TaxID=1917215 RepID=UPI003D0E43A8